LFQIWVFPKERNIKPSYDQRKFNPADRVNKWQVVAGGPLVETALQINQDAYFSLADIDSGKTLEYEVIHKHNGAYLMVISGKIDIEGKVLGARDAVAMSEMDSFSVQALEATELLVVEVPMK
jgi:redox-sensitive bicupin YhaK (pirin superfamily)